MKSKKKGVCSRRNWQTMSSILSFKSNNENDSKEKDLMTTTTTLTSTEVPSKVSEVKYSSRSWSSAEANQHQLPSTVLVASAKSNPQIFSTMSYNTRSNRSRNSQDELDLDYSKDIYVSLEKLDQSIELEHQRGSDQVASINNNGSIVNVGDADEAATSESGRDSPVVAEELKINPKLEASLAERETEKEQTRNNNLFKRPLVTDLRDKIVSNEPKPKLLKTATSYCTSKESKGIVIPSVRKGRSAGNISKSTFYSFRRRSSSYRINSWTRKANCLRSQLQRTVDCDQSQRYKVKLRNSITSTKPKQVHTTQAENQDANLTPTSISVASGPGPIAKSRSQYTKNPYVCLTPIEVLGNANRFSKFNCNLSSSKETKSKPDQSQERECDNDNSGSSISSTKDEVTRKVRLTRRASVVAGEMEAVPSVNIRVPAEPVSPTNIYVCDYCLTYYKTPWNHKKHHEGCKHKHKSPPGNLVYKKENVEIYEIDGLKKQFYCYNLSKLSKLYVNSLSGLKHTTLFLYYVLYVSGKFAGYFSKEKSRAHLNNLGVLLVLPSHQKMGLGKLLVSFSYEISKIEKKIGTPERPLSQAGTLCYISYWIEKVVQYIAEHDSTEITLVNLSKATYIQVDDLIITFKSMCAIYAIDRCLVLKIPDSIFKRFLHSKEVPDIKTEIDSNATGEEVSRSDNDSTKLPKHCLDWNCISYIPMKERGH